MRLLENKKCYEHHWTMSSKVCEVPVSFLSNIRHLKSTNVTDMPNGELKHQNIVFDNIEEFGMIEPLLIVTSPKNKTIRLESGNHRIKTAIERNYTHLPCAFVLYDKGFFHIGNGDHFYNIDETIIDVETILKFNKATYPIYINPKKIIKNNNFIFI